MLTYKEVVGGVKALEAARERWLESGVDYLSAEMEESLDRLFALCDSEEIEREAWPVVRELDRFEDLYDAWRDEARRIGNRADPSGSAAMWRRFGYVQQAVDRPRVFTRPEPIQQLVRANVSPKQIAKIYQWWNEFNLPDEERVQREIDTPGSEYDPKQWKDKREVKYWGELEAWYTARSESLRSGTKSTPKRREPAREPLDDLIRQKVNVAQIVKMKGGEVTEEDVRHRAAELGIALDAGTVYLSQYEAQRELARDREKSLQAELDRVREGDEPLSSKLSSIETYAELGDDMEARMVRMAEDGHRPAGIARALTGQSAHPVTAGQVGKVLKAYRKKQEGEATVGVS